MSTAPTRRHPPHRAMGPRHRPRRRSPRMAAHRAGLPAVSRMARRTQLATRQHLHRDRAVTRHAGETTQPEAPRAQLNTSVIFDSRLAQCPHRGSRRLRLRRCQAQQAPATPRSTDLRRQPIEHRRLPSRAHREQPVAPADPGITDTFCPCRPLMPYSSSGPSISSRMSARMWMVSSGLMPRMPAS